jgi:hypothetical protein
MNSIWTREIDPSRFSLAIAAILAITLTMYLFGRDQKPHTQEDEFKRSILVADHFFEAYDTHPRDLVVLRGNLTDEQLRVGLIGVARTTESATRKVGALMALGEYGFLGEMDEEQLARLIQDDTRTEVLSKIRHFPEFGGIVDEQNPK